MSVTYDKISTRDAFGIALVEAAREYPNLFVIGADTTKSMGCKPMMAEFPDRVINNGIAEQNMAMIGAGIAASGGRAVVATYAPFASMRISEQIRTFVCYPNLDVKVISGLAGLSGEPFSEGVDVGGFDPGTFPEEPQFGIHAQGGKHARFEQDIGNVGRNKFIEQEGDIHGKSSST